MARPKKQSTIAKLPEEAEVQTKPKISEKDRDAALLALIKKGGRSARPQTTDERPVERRISLRIPEDLAERIKNAAQAREVKTSAHTWMVEAMLERLKKEGF